MCTRTRKYPDAEKKHVNNFGQRFRYRREIAVVISWLKLETSPCTYIKQVRGPINPSSKVAYEIFCKGAVEAAMQPYRRWAGYFVHTNTTLAPISCCTIVEAMVKVALCIAGI